MPLQSFQPHKRDADTCSAVRSHRLVSYGSLNAYKNSPGAAGKGKTQLISSSPQSSAPTFLLPVPQPLIISPIPKPVCSAMPEGNPNLLHLHRSQRKFALVLVSPAFMASHFFPTLQCLYEGPTSVTALHCLPRDSSTVPSKRK